jgi:hypothetical protein
MPKVPLYPLGWLPIIEVYELYRTQDQEALRIIPDSPEWFAWLEQVSSFAFEGKRGRYTARKESKQRGDRYWYDYLLFTVVTRKEKTCVLMCIPIFRV